MSDYCRITKYSHHFVVSHVAPRLRPVLGEFLKPLVEWAGYYQRGKFTKEPKKVYAASPKDRSEFRFHIHQYEDFMALLKMRGIPESMVKVTHKRMYTPTEVEFTIPDHWVPREDQPRVIAYMEDDYISKVVTLQTGKGKTFCALKAVESAGVLPFITVAGKYIEKWTEDLEETLQLSKKEICVIRGSAALLNAVNLALAGEFNYKAILITTTTLQRFYKDWEHGKLRGYPIKPVDLYKTLGVGIKVIDEAHENQHMVFKQDLYGHLPKVIFLSATIRSDSPFRNRMMEIQWPMRMRFQPGDFDRYIRVKGISYELHDADRVRYINQQKMYSHTLFEESIMKKPKYLADYLGMIDRIVYDYYVTRMEEGQRALVFAATKDMCGKIAEHLARRNPALEVARYISEDDYEVLMESDISVSTALSAGTGVDIDGLRFVLMTTSINSSQQNIQIVGRLRRLKKWPDLEPEFLYIFAHNVPKQVEYHNKKVKLLRPRVKTVNEQESLFRVGSGRKAA